MNDPLCQGIVSDVKFLLFFQISGLETDLASQKEDSKQKLESLETQMSQVTADLTKLKENDKNEELSTKLSQLGTGIYSISTFLIQIRLSNFHLR